MLQVLLAFRGSFLGDFCHLTEITCKSFLGKRLETAENLNLPKTGGKKALKFVLDTESSICSADPQQAPA